MSQAVSKAAPLQAELRLSQSLSEFESELPKDKKQDYIALKTSSTATPAPLDVMRLTAEIDMALYNHGVKKSYGKRMVSFLDGVQKFVALGDLLIGGTQGMTGRGIWFSVRFCLLAATGWSPLMDAISTLFMDIGRSIPRYQDMVSLYPRSHKLRNYMTEYFIVIIQLCRKILSISQSSGFIQFLASYVTSLDDFKTDLKKWSTAIKDEVTTQSMALAIAESTANSKIRALTRADVQSRTFRQQQKLRAAILDKCSTYDHETPWKQIRKHGNVGLFRTDQVYMDWKMKQESTTLIYSGTLGSGKSVTLANIVDDLLVDESTCQCPITYLFSRFEEPETLKARTVIGSLARQCFSSRLDFFNSVSPKVSIDKLLDIKELCKILATIYRGSQNKVYVVLDGLDEFEPSERESLLEAIKKLQKAFPISVCIASRMEPDKESKFQPTSLTAPMFTRIPEENPELKEYIAIEVEHRVDTGDILLANPDLKDTIKQVLETGAQGMFMWVSLLISTLFKLPSDAHVLKALADLPIGLPATYERLLSKFSSNEYQKPILQLISVAMRPLTTLELREALIMEPGCFELQTMKLAHDMVTVLACCAGLVILDEEELTVRFAHHSIYQYLLYTGNVHGFTEFSAHQRMAQIVTTYLNISEFDTRLARTDLPKLHGQSIVKHVVSAATSTSSASRVLGRLLSSKDKGPSKDIAKVLLEAYAKCRPSADLVFANYAKKYCIQHIVAAVDKDTTTLELLQRLKDNGALTLTIDEDERLDVGAWIISNGYLGGFSILYSHGILDSASQGLVYQTLKHAAQHGDERTIEEYLDHPRKPGSYLDEIRSELVRDAAELGHAGVICLILKHGPLPASMRHSARKVLRRCYWLDEESFRILLKYIDSKSLSELNVGAPYLLHYAVQKHYNDLVAAWINDKHTIVDKKDYMGITAFWYAAICENVEALCLLIKTGVININTCVTMHTKFRTWGAYWVPPGSYTPLEVAYKGRHRQIIGILLELPGIQPESLRAQLEEDKSWQDWW